MTPLNRRYFIGMSAAAMGTLAAGQARTAEGEIVAYPDPAIEIIDPAFAKYRLDLSAVERLYTGARWSEGPVWVGDGRYLLWSDIPNDRVLRWDETTGEVGEFLKPAGYHNGHTRDREGRVISCEHLARRVSRIEYDGSVTVLADRFEGKRLNSPNDVVVKSDGSIWFTDPPYGILGHYEGEPAERELPTNVYRIDATTGVVTVATGDMDSPNGLAFSPDERRLYIAETGPSPKRIRVFDVDDAGRLSNDRVFVQCAEGETPDGFRVDVDGNLWCGWGMSPELNGVRVFDPEGKPIGHIHLPERCANVAFGGRHRNRLFMTASQSLYSVYVNTQGVSGG